MTPQNKNVRLLVGHLYVDASVDGIEFYCFNTEDDRNSVESQASFRMDVAHEMSKFTHGEAGGIRYISFVEYDILKITCSFRNF